MGDAAAGPMHAVACCPQIVCWGAEQVGCAVGSAVLSVSCPGVARSNCIDVSIGGELPTVLVWLFLVMTRVERCVLRLCV